jgi:hypothetical protein
MKRTLLVLGITLLAAPAQADIKHVMTQSAQISVDQAYSSATRGGTTYSSQGTNVTPSVTANSTTTNNRIGGLDMSTITNGVPDIVNTDYEVTTAGSAYSLTESLTVGDTIPSAGTTVTNGVVPALPVMATTITGAGGETGSLAATVTSSGQATVVAGDAGTSAILSTKVELEID